MQTTRGIYNHNNKGFNLYSTFQLQKEYKWKSETIKNLTCLVQLQKRNYWNNERYVRKETT